MNTKQGNKLITIFRILANKIATIQEIIPDTKHIDSRNNVHYFSRSEVRKLLILAEEHGLVYSFSLSDISRPRGRPPTIRKKRDTGRRPKVYTLTYKSRFLMRFDPELSKEWKAIEQAYYKIERPNTFDSYINLKYAIKNHPVLSKFEKPYYFDGELQRTLLNPLLFETSLSDNQFNELSDELVKLIKENVRSEFVKNYESTLQNSLSRLEKMIRRHNLMINKIKKIET